MDPGVLAQLRAIAEGEGRQLQSVVEEALKDLIEKKNSSRPRASVMAHYEDSLIQFGALYERLAR